MGGPLVSVIMAAYNGGPYLQPAIASVLAQSYANLELLVVDDGTTDGSIEAAKRTFDDPRIRWFHQANAGKPAAMNFALEQARGKYYALQDADDLSYPTRLERLVEVMEANTDLAAVYSGHDLILGDTRCAPKSGARDRDTCRGDIEAFRMPAHDPTAMYRMATVRGMQYGRDLLLGEGYDYILRVGEQWPVMVVGECLYSYRIHDASITRSDPVRRHELVLEVIRRACQRRGLNFEELLKSPRRCVAKGYPQQDNNLAAHFIDSVVDQRRSGKRKNALNTALQCSRLHPLAPHYHKALVYALVPHWAVGWLRQKRSRQTSG